MLFNMTADSSEGMRVNHDITATAVFLIAPDGGSKGVVNLEEALVFAENLELDLVEIQPDAEPPVCKVMDFGKHSYIMSVRARENRRSIPKNVTKEVRFRPTTEEHDYQTKMRQVNKFLNKGFKVRVVVIMKGREVTHPELATTMMGRILTALTDVSVIEANTTPEAGVLSATFEKTTT